eukprot:487429_1
MAMKQSRIRGESAKTQCLSNAYFSTDEKKTEKPNTDTKKKDTDSLHDAINRMKGEDGSEGGTSSSSSFSNDDVLYKISNAASSFTDAVSETWEELINSNKSKDVNKSIHEPRSASASDIDNEAADNYEGTTAIMLFDEEENLGTFDKMQRRLSEAPIIQNIIAGSEQLYQKSGAKEAREKLDDVAEDAREAWETSQNPWVYRASSVYDTFTAESEFALAEKELRVLDPEFNLEDWKEGLVEVTLPRIMQLFLEGKIKDLKPSLGESVYNRLAAEAKVREKEGLNIDTNVLGIMNSEVLSCTPDHVNKGAPIIMVHFMCQQINCVRKKETGEITEGSEDDIRAYSYVAALQREYDEETGELNWKIIDFMLNGAIAYL